MKLKMGHFRDDIFLLVLLMFSISLLCFLVYFDIPIARQAFGFIFLTIIPGATIIQLLGLKEMNRLEKLLISVGLSIAFVMIAGLILNGLFPILGFSNPLQLLPFFGALIGFTVLGGVLMYKRKESVIKSWKFGFSKREFLMLLFIVPVLLSVLGTYYVNAYGNSIFLMLMIIVIASLFAILVLSKEQTSSRLYVVAVFVIALSLLLSSSLISKYLVSFGSDSPLEYMVFRITANNQHWAANLSADINFGRFNSMLSITILPTLYYRVLNMDPSMLFKIMYPLIFSLVPVCLYQMWQQYFGKKYALIAAVLLMSDITFYTEMLGVNRQIVAELFFSLLLLVIFNKKIKNIPKLALSVTFFFGLVTSHYGLSLIFLFFICAYFAFAFIAKRVSRRVTAVEVVIFSTIMFLWYIYTSSGTVFNSFLSFGQNVLSQLGSFFSPASRGQEVLTGLGLSSSPTIWNSISRGFAYAIEILIIIGFIGLITKKLKTQADKDYLLFTYIAAIFLGVLIIVPGLANTLNITRFYEILLFFLAPVCVLGAEFLVTFLKKRKKLFISILLLSIIIPYFLFQTGFIYELTKSGSYSISLSKNRIDTAQLFNNYGYVDAASVSSAEWFSENIIAKNSVMYSDDVSMNENILRSYGLTYNGMNTLSNVTLLEANATIYLSTLNTETHALFNENGEVNMSQLSFNFSDLNCIYNNGYSEIYRVDH